MRCVASLVLVFLVACAGRSKPESEHAGLYPFGPPIPVPQPVIRRAELSRDLQELWMRVELAVDVRPPEPPADATKEAIDAWADGPFSRWFHDRQHATEHALAATYALRTRPAYERGIGTALFGYMYEDMASGMRGAPVAEHIAKDHELLQVYTDTLNTALRPYADLAARAYYTCLSTFVHLGDERWVEWAAYCDTRGSEVVDTYGLIPPEPKADPAVPENEPEQGVDPAGETAADTEST